MQRRDLLLRSTGLTVLSLTTYDVRPAAAEESVEDSPLSLFEINQARPLDSLEAAQIKELQSALNRLGYQSGPVDGLVGTMTMTAWSEFKDDIFQSDSELVGPGSLVILKDKLDEIGAGKIHDFSTKAGTIEAIKYECNSLGIGLKTQIAYVLATVEHETARTFQPVREAFWLTEEQRRTNPIIRRYYPYYGRGYVQLTWEFNYKKYSRVLGVDLVNNPDLAMNPNIALFILVHGFKTGVFTGRKITDYINEAQTDFVRARRCINGSDKHLRSLPWLRDIWPLCRQVQI